jgi:hypothetical protein
MHSLKYISHVIYNLNTRTLMGGGVTWITHGSVCAWKWVRMEVGVHGSGYAWKWVRMEMCTHGSVYV